MIINFYRSIYLPIRLNPKRGHRQVPGLLFFFFFSFCAMLVVLVVSFSSFNVGHKVSVNCLINQVTVGELSQIMLLNCLKTHVSELMIVQFHPYCQV